MSSKAASAPTSRPVHPCVLSVFDGNSAEYSTWAHISPSRNKLPNLVTAQSSTLRIFSIDEPTGKLILTQTFFNLAGSVCFLATLPGTADHDNENEDDDEESSDALLIGFAGHPRLAVVFLSSSSSGSSLLLATSLLDLTPALLEVSLGSVTPLEEDLIATTEHKNPRVVTVSVVLGGGVAVAALTLHRIHGSGGNGGWRASEPYLLPLATLHGSISTDSTTTVFKTKGRDAVATTAASMVNAAGVQSISHGFGDILSVCFLPGYLEPTLCLLHSGKHGRACPGRLGRPSGVGGTRYGLVVTAVSVTVFHRRSAVLWSVEVPADALALTSFAKGCLVLCANSLVHITHAGHVVSVLGVNGWVRSTLPPSLLHMVEPNPWPLPKLAIQLDGAHITFVSERVAFVALRHGQLYLLQCSMKEDQWSLIPLGQTVGAIGQVASLMAWPFADTATASLWKGLVADDKAKEGSSMPRLSMGLVFAGSRLGDCSLLAYALQSDVPLWEPVKQEEGLAGTKRKFEDEELPIIKSENLGITMRVSTEYEGILQLEEDALYAPTGEDDLSFQASLVDSNQPHIVPPSDDDEEMQALSSKKKRERPRLQRMTMIHSLHPMDSITCLGPLGPGCSGPLSRPSYLATAASAAAEGPTTESATKLSATAQIVPCGYGSSGGLALVTAPGRDDRSVLGEADCLNVQCLFGLPHRGLVLLGMSETQEGGGVSVLELQQNPNKAMKTEDNDRIGGDVKLDEVDLAQWCSKPKKGKKDSLYDPLHVLTKTALLSASELNDIYLVFLVKEKLEGDGQETPNHAIVVLNEVGKRHQVCFKYDLDPDRGVLLSATPMVPHNDGDGAGILFGCTWSSGIGTITNIQISTGKKGKFTVSESVIAGNSPTSTTTEMSTDEVDEEELYYRSDRIVSMDVFSAPKGIFSSPPADSSTSKVVKRDVKKSTAECDGDMEGVQYDFDEEDLELYEPEGTGHRSRPSKSDGNTISVSTVTPTDPLSEDMFVGVCRQSGLLQVYSFSDLDDQNKDPQPVWEARGCGHGVPVLTSSVEELLMPRTPRMQKVHASEFRFFFTGPSIESSTVPPPTSAFREFCLAVETNVGDMYLYTLNSGPLAGMQTGTTLTRVQLGVVARSSIEQSRHRAKLRRKGILASSVDEDGTGALDLTTMRHNRLYPFMGISGQDGLFAATARPMWFVSDRGATTFLCHRSRHVAPAGGKSRPVTGFCSGLQGLMDSGEMGFLTLHERIGRVGSQRLTIFRGISNVYSEHGLFPGGGLCVEKVPLGVTVRRIQLIDDSSISSGDHPLYAVLISRELESDQSILNDDGVAKEERQRLKEEKENEKIKRQVEADLGGFDVEQEWVEEIERENCFDVDRSIGGAPPIHKSSYALWIVDASNNWNVVDSHELDEFENVLTMKVMPLTEVADATGEAEAIEVNDEADTLFVALGTGIVDPDGEDVSSKGRVLLFEVKRQTSSGLQVADLTLVYEKDIQHGPVTSLSCLTCEGRSRLVIGAGSDVNVEQWGNGKLTQVGFFRANMHILDILLFKTFFLLSDAYDSLYFLVWRESDKSLTLLAKDYEPIPVYAAGLVSRGGSMSFVLHDDRQNLQFFQYAPGDPAARGGNKLVVRADCHLGTQTVALQSHSCRSSLIINSATPTSTIAALKQQDSFFGRTDDDQRLGVHFGTTDGGLVTIIPLSEPAYWRLTALQSVMTNALESNCALSHRAWRLFRRTPRRGGCRNNDRKKGVIDGDLVAQYADLALADQEDLASAIGSTVDLILDNLLELKCASMVI